MDNWETRLTFEITPKSGPLRKMVRLHDAKQALIADLPQGYLKRVHWLKAGHALLAAAETGARRDIECAFEALVFAIVEEGWFTRGSISITEPPRSAAPRYEPPSSVVPFNVRASVGNITPRRAA